jgi:predicted NAD/FAD-binding protein
MWRILRDIARFYRAANGFLDESSTGRDSTTLAEFLSDGGSSRAYSREFVELHLIPLGAAVWSADPATFAEFPARSLLTFLANHGLLGVGNRPQWRCIPGGSRTYVDALARRFPGTIHLESPVTKVRRTELGIEIDTPRMNERFDRVILAVHSDQALGMLVDPSIVEREVLGAIRYQPNRATLHTDIGLLSPRRRAWAAWNYDRHHAAVGGSTVTYDMTTLQHLEGEHRYLVSLNSDEWIDSRRVIRSFDYAHPVYDVAAVDAQSRFDEIDGVGGVHFCGAWWGHGFHEDGMVSGHRVCARVAQSARDRSGAGR